MNAAWLIVVLLIALIPTVADAQVPAEPELPTEAEAPFALTVNHVPKGDIIVVLRGDDVFVDRADLRAAGVELAGGQDVEVAGRRLLRLGSVSPPLRYELDEKEIALSIVAPPDLLPHTAIDLGARPPDVVYATDTSAFFNYAPRVADDGRLDLYEEMGLSVDGKLLFSSAYLSNTQEPVRGISNLVIDDRPGLIRYTLGDALVRTGTLGAGGFVGGVTVSRNYELDPYSIKTPRIGLRGSTPTPATIDVLVNGQRVRTEEVAPGTFEIDNLNVSGGSGFAGYVIRDVFGNERHVVSPFYVSGDTLAPGLEEYTYSLGFSRTAVGIESWAYGRPVAYAYYRRGLDEHNTVGARAESSTERISAGPSFTVLAGIGQFDLDVSGSFDAGGPLGGAAQLGYSYSSRSFGCNLIMRVNSNRYSTIDLAPSDDRPIADFSALLSVPIGSRVTLSYRSAVASVRDSGVFASFGAQTSVRITNSLNWLSSGVRTKREREPAEWEVTTTVSYAFSGGYSAVASGRVGRQHESVRLDTSKSLPSGDGFGYRASATLADEISGEGLVQYQALFGRYAARYTVYGQNPQLSADAAGAIVVVPGAGVFPTLPVQSSYGVIRLAGVEGVRGYGNHQELGTTDRNGSLVVPNLLPYYGNHLSIASEDVPLEYEMYSTETVLAPPPRGVALAEFKIRIPHFYRGRLSINDGGKRIVPEYGQVRIELAGEEAFSPLGEEGEFELSGLDPGAHAALIEWSGGTCAFVLMLPASQDTLIDLGTLTCANPKPAAQ
jgi:outer membrane usher protein